MSLVPERVREHEGLVESNLGHQRQRLAMLFFGLVTEARDDVRRDANVYYTTWERLLMITLVSNKSMWQLTGNLLSDSSDQV